MTSTRTQTPSQDGIFTDWKPRHAALFTQHPTELSHGIAQTGLFSDEALACLIEATPRSDYHVSTMDPNSHDPRSRREGVIDGLSGSEVLEAIKSGHIWLNLRNPGDHVGAYDGLLGDIYRELEMRVPGLKTFKQRMTVLISSPKVHVGYHCDVPGQTLWQVRGTKRVWVYPNREPFLPQSRLEKIVLGEAHEVSLDYEPWFDDFAKIVDLEPGRMLTWPLNCPHRIVNHDCLNVSVTTEHWTPELRNAYVSNYANGILRNRLGLNRLSQSAESPAFLGKLGLAAVYKYSGLQKGRAAGFKIDFKVDPSAPQGIVDIPAYELRK